MPLNSLKYKHGVTFRLNIWIYMILSKILTINYKSCRNTDMDIINNDPNIFIGMNDCGKTTLLKSLELLFTPKKHINYHSRDFSNKYSIKSDLSHTPKNINEINIIFKKNKLPELDIVDGNYIVIASKLELEDIEYLDEKSSLNFRWLIFSSNENNKYFWITRVFDCENKTCTIYYTMLDSKKEEFKKLYSLGKNDIKNKIKKFDLTNNTKNLLSQFENMKALYNYNKSIFFHQWCSSNTWAKDIEKFPTLRYLDWNQSVETIKKIAKDILSDSISTEHKLAEIDANKYSLIAQNKINNELKDRGIYNEVEGVESIKANVFFKVECQISDLLIKKTNSEGDVHIDNQGEGVKRQLWFSLLKSEAEKIEHSTKRFIWCFDEPETHLHPRSQRKFFSILKSLSSKNFQILISTHSTIFVDSSNILNVRGFNKINNYTKIECTENIKDIYLSLGLRNSDFLFYDKFIFVEGLTEEALIPRLYELYTGNSLIDDHINLVVLNGGKKYETARDIYEQVISESLKNFIFILDSDMKTEKINKSNVFFCGKQDIEDSIHIDVWFSIANDIVGEDINIKKEDIKQLINDISDEKGCNNTDKFYNKFKNYIRNEFISKNTIEIENINKIICPKGLDWGNLIANHIKSKEYIPDILCEAFNKIQEK